MTSKNDLSHEICTVFEYASFVVVNYAETSCLQRRNVKLMRPTDPFDDHNLSS